MDNKDLPVNKSRRNFLVGTAVMGVGIATAGGIAFSPDAARKTGAVFDNLDPPEKIKQVFTKGN